MENSHSVSYLCGFLDDVLYWSDARNSRIYACQTNTTDCSMFLSINGADFKDIATDGDYIYYADYKKQ